MKYPAIIAAVALALVAVGLMARNAELPYATKSKESLEYYRQGMDELNSFRFDRAVAALERAVAADPDFALARTALANAFASQGDRKRAEREAQVADSLAAGLRNPEERILVQVQLANHGLAGAERRDSLFAEAVRLLPRDPIVMDLRAQAAMAQSRMDVADSLWRELLQMDPNYARAYNWLGYAAAEGGNYDEALAHLRKYAFLAPDLANPHDSLGEILLRIGNYEEAEAELRRALELQPDFYYSLVNIGRLYVATGRVAKAVQLFAKLREQFAGTAFQVNVDQMTIEAYQVHGMEAERRRAVADFVRRHAESAAGKVWRSFMLVDLGRPAEGTALMDSVTAAIEQDYRGADQQRRKHNTEMLRQVHAALVARAAGDPQSVVVHRRAALQAAEGFLSPHEQIPMRVQLARDLSEVGAWEDVLEQTAIIASINPRVLPALALQAQAESALGRREEAARTLVLLRANLALADPDLPERAVADSLATVLGVEAGV